MTTANSQVAETMGVVDEMVTAPDLTEEPGAVARST
jgi:hypothetical protein